MERTRRDAIPEHLEGLKRALAASGLTAILGALRSRHDVPTGARTRSSLPAFRSP